MKPVVIPIDLKAVGTGVSVALEDKAVRDAGALNDIAASGHPAQIG